MYGTSWQVKTLSAVIVFTVLLPRVSFGQDQIVIGGLNGLDPDSRHQEVSVLLALSGGGVRGLATIGILRAFEEKGIRVAAISGTSMGGIVGGLYAAGYTPGQLEQIAHNLDFAELFSNTPPRITMFQTKRRERGRDILSIRFDGWKPEIPQALTGGQKLTEILTGLTTPATYHSERDFTKLPVPFKTVCTNMETGQAVVLDSGSLADAMRATMAFPLAFTGLEINGQVLMDGGMVAPIPVDVVRSMCDSVSFVVAVNTASPLLKAEHLATPVDIANQATSIMTADKLSDALAKADIAVEPVSEEFQSNDFQFKDSLIRLGYRSGLATADSIRNIILEERDSLQFVISHVWISELPSDYHRYFEPLQNRAFVRSELVGRLKEIVRRVPIFELRAVLIPISAGNAHARFGLKVTGAVAFTPAELTINVIGNQVIPDSTILQEITVTDSPVTAPRLRAMVDNIETLYYRNRYDMATVERIDVDPASRRITLVIDEAVIERIDVEGTERTRQWFVRSLFPLQVGEPYSNRQAAQGIANIYGTDLFERVSVDLVPADDGAVVQIRVVEKNYHQLRFGWHLDDEYESEEFLEVLDDNLAGAGLELLLHARYSPDRRHFYSSFKTDRIFSSYVTSNIRIHHKELDRHLYNSEDSLIDKRHETKTGAEFRLGQQIARLGTVTGAFQWDEVSYEMEEARTSEEFGLRILKLESLVENFDRVPFPHTGKKHYFELQFAGKLVGGDVEYTRFFTSIEAYFPFGRHVNYHPKLAVGLSRSGLPVSEKFYLGGMGSFSGMRTHRLNGDKMILMNHEIRFKLPLWLYLSLRYDLGDVFAGADEIKLGELRHGGGVFLSWDFPLGPLEIGYGIAEDDFNRLYLRFGFEF